MIEGAHSVIYSSDPEADRAFFRDVLALPNVDVGHGWLIFGLPPAEVAFHPADRSGKHELYLMVRDIEKFADQMRGRGVPCAAIRDERWGRLVNITLPGGGALGVYQPRHERPPPAPGA
jgi:catechol 2,3-dioxygenase-like lactoylglutathione lyase family enzyme